jgi:hypothetical protein
MIIIWLLKLQIVWIRKRKWRHTNENNNI